MTGSIGPRSIGIVGAGTMGAGIAQVAAVAGRGVLLADAVPGAAERAVAGVRDRVKAQVARGRLSVDPDALDLTPVDSVAGLAGCGVVIEAIIEDLTVKRALFSELERVVAIDTILASNTSSLSPTAGAGGGTTRRHSSPCHTSASGSSCPACRRPGCATTTRGRTGVGSRGG